MHSSSYNLRENVYIVGVVRVCVVFKDATFEWAREGSFFLVWGGGGGGGGEGREWYLKLITAGNIYSIVAYGAGDYGGGNFNGARGYKHKWDILGSDGSTTPFQIHWSSLQ